MKVLYWPRYSNPYQDLFYGEDSPAFSSEAKTIFDAIEVLVKNPSETVVFHLHWLNFLFNGKTPEKRERTVNTFIGACRKFCEAGGTLVWTVHNLAEHDKLETDLEMSLRKELCRLASALFVHGYAAKTAVIESLPEAEGKIHNVVHGHYIDCYPNTVPNKTARAIVGLFKPATVFLSLGWIRPYKGLNDLCSAMKSLGDGSNKAELVIAGKMRPIDESYFDDLFANARNFRIHEGWVSDENVQTYMNASDFMVLPYRASLTSGAALLSFSFSLPIIAPNIGSFPELIQDGQNGFLYDPDEEGGLQKVMERAIATEPEARSQMKRVSLDTALIHDWDDARKAFINVIDIAIQ
ncbi:hypothetical protein RKLH11_1838 [Rhodobacteraceae bacterium KLH11]|nr:hypothetical protein RKLH11_1838 [Rhodobacteraceae bacterium KLH11]